MKKHYTILLFFCCILLLGNISFGGSIVRVEVADKNVIVVVVETPDGENTPEQDTSLWQIDGFNLSKIGRYSYVWSEEKANGNVYSTTLRHHMYLKLTENLTNGITYNINTPFGIQSLTFNDQQTRCESINVNQVGYFGGSSVRYANISIYLGDLGANTISPLPDYSVFDTDDNVVLTGTVSVYGFDAGAGGEVYRINLSGLPDGGPYRISVSGYGCSYPFGVGADYINQSSYVHVRGLYHQRCGIALEEPYTSFTRDICHTTVQITDAVPYDFITQTSSTTRSISGGYHDAGDFDKRAFHTLIPAWLLNLYEAFPVGFTDNQYNIPESGNGIPDLLDEALWGIKVWENLQESDGAIRAGIESDRHPVYGVVSAATDNNIYRTYKRWGHTTASGAGLFAHASRLVSPFDSTRSVELLKKAESAWAYLMAHDNDPDMLTAHSAQKMYAALELYLATGEENYHNAFKTYANHCLTSGWPEQYNPQWWNGNTITNGMIFTPYFFGYLITNMPVDQDIKDGYTSMLQNAANSMLTESTNKSYPVGYYNSGYSWGNATSQGRYADPMIFMYRLNSDKKYLNAISQLADYSLGLNPLGKSYVTGLGANPPNNPTHLDSYFSEKAGQGSVPGIVVYGPISDPSSVNWEKAVWSKVYPSFTSLPEQRRYTDGWSFIGADEFTTWETMAQNVVMYGFLSSVGESVSDDIPNSPSELKITPTPGGKIKLSWNDNSGNEDGFKIHRKTGSNGTYDQIATVAAGTTSYEDGSISEATEYFYNISAYNSFGESDFSNEVSTVRLPYKSVDIETTNSGNTTDICGTIKIVGAGSQIDGTSDKFRYTYQDNLTGDITIVARIDSFSAFNGNALAGIMIRQDISTGAKYYGILVNRDLHITGKYRNNPEWSFTGDAGVTTLPIWLKITKTTSNNIMTSYTSTDGVIWTQRYQDWVQTNINEPFTAGLAVSAGEEQTFGTATFSNISWPIEVKYYTLITDASNGSILLNPAANCYASGFFVNVKATPETGYKFDNWSGDLSGSSNPEIIIMDNNKSISANFSDISTQIGNAIDDTNNLAQTGTGRSAIYVADHQGNVLSTMTNGLITNESNDSWTGNSATKTEDYWGIGFDQNYGFNKVVYTTGLMFDDGGWFSSNLKIQVRQGSEWVDVTGLKISPDYSSDSPGSHVSYTFKFENTWGNAIRVQGIAGGSSTFTSISEFEIYYGSFETSATELKSNNQNKPQLLVYPNPFNGCELKITIPELIPEGSTLKVINQNGQLLYNVTNIKKGEVLISFESQLVPGLYFVSLYNGSEMLNAKVIVK